VDYNSILEHLYIPGHSDELMGKDDSNLSLSVNWLCLYLMMNSLQASIRVKSLLQLVAFTTKDLKNVISFLKT
jgi:hypothetical protein